MPSNINPQNINGAYPVAGQDNDSQGFRDNFTNTRTNFQFAAAEITDLENKAVLKAALDGTNLNNDMGGSILSNAQLQDMSETKVIFGVLADPFVVNLNYAAGSYQTFALPNDSGVENVTLGFSNFPPAGAAGRIRIQILVPANGLAYTVTLPNVVSLGTTGVQGLVANVLTFAGPGTFEFEFETSDGGSTITMFDLNRPLVAGFTNQLQVGSTLALTSTEDLAASAAANLAVTTSRFSTATAETATLAAGAAGQIKVFAMFADSGNMVITVANAGWKTSGSGTITFSDIGQTVTCMFINAKWFVIGQGAGVANTFAQFA